MGRPKQTEESFWRQIKKGPACWEWQGYCRSNGYAEVSWNNRNYMVYRVAAWLSGLISGLDSKSWVLHKCDNPRCCRPDHLFLGCAADNSQDMVNKSRQARGERIGIAKLTAEKVKQLRAEHARGSSFRGLSRKFGLDKSNIKAAITRKTWKHVS